ncbi:helix-turn-helix domain-containing protein [Kibdelosporangium lantanae]|uniref:Helix-turn-helix domain-containing protein n=1 Tax=Kibdelosporangium lantanae TaxID=1497396 RepID=A0ABW3MG02_9PSEU
MAKQPLSLAFSGARLREWRERAGLTQQDLAEKCGLSRFQISRWETGSAKPDVRSLPLLVRGLGAALGRPTGRRDSFTVDDLLAIGPRVVDRGPED